LTNALIFGHKNMAVLLVYLKYWLVSMATIETNGNHFWLHLAGADDSIVNLS